MTKKVVLIKQPKSERDDRAAALLAAWGYELDWRVPGDGDALPDPNDEHVGAIIYGGPESANDDKEKPYIRAELDWIEQWLPTEKPFLGICLGGQLLARTLGAEVKRHDEGLHEIGYVPITPTPWANGFLGTPMHVYQWHKEGFELPGGTELLATGPDFPNQAYRYGEKTYGIQFHPEITPNIFPRWFGEAADSLAQPGAHPPERQVADGARYDGEIGDWFAGFLKDWLDTSERR